MDSFAGFGCNNRYVDETGSGFAREHGTPSSHILGQTEGACGAFVDDVSILKPKKGDALEVASKPVGCQIGVREGCLWVSLSVPSVLSVYAWDGRRILSGHYEAGEQTFRLPSGIYVVRIGEYVQKVRIHN